jgi:hydrogenase/urease accessory protein HupE
MRFTHYASLILLFVISVLPAQAHQLRPAIVTLTFNLPQSVTVAIETNAEALLAEIGPGHDNTDDAPEAQVYRQLRELKPQQLKEKFAGFKQQYRQGLKLLLSDQEAVWQFVSIMVPEIGDTRVSRKSVITYRAEIPPGASTAVWSYAAKYGDAVVNFIDSMQGQKNSYWLVKGEQSPLFKLDDSVQQRGWLEVALDYTELGFLHILPKGLDHILFVIGLFLLSTRLSPLLWQVTAFTLAHTITLALSIYGLINVSAAIVEPLIALSIAYVGIENLLTRELKPWRVVIVFLFGLLHGMGFAGVLTELGLPESDFVTALITFNIGVELGQLSIILLAFLAVFWLRKNDVVYRKLVVIPGSLFIALMGLYWAWERISF